jgi:hypothetical protein
MAYQREKIVCLREPDISYTSNKWLQAGKQYIGEYRKTAFQDGCVETYVVYDEETGLRLGEYFKIDFADVAENRNIKIEELLA